MEGEDDNHRLEPPPPRREDANGGEGRQPLPAPPLPLTPSPSPPAPPRCQVAAVTKRHRRVVLLLRPEMQARVGPELMVAPAGAPPSRGGQATRSPPPDHTLSPLELSASARQARRGPCLLLPGICPAISLAATRKRDQGTRLATSGAVTPKPPRLAARGSGLSFLHRQGHR
jgi:hypothetical protein